MSTGSSSPQDASGPSIAGVPLKPAAGEADGATLRVPDAAIREGETLRVPAPGKGGHHGEAAGPEDAGDSGATVMVPRGTGPGSAPPGDAAFAGKGSAQEAGRHPLGALAPGSIICGNCVVRSTFRPHETTRAGLYDCDAPEGRVMVKVAPAQYPPVPELWARLPELNHPCILRVFRVQKEHGFWCEIQEYCEGGTLDDCVARDGRPTLSWEVVERGIVTPFLRGIQYLHSEGIVHRDIKPQNLYLRRQGNLVSLVIGDFDISSVIENRDTSRDTSRGAGTHFYMAPEAFPRFVDPGAARAAAIVSPASDFYSFGVVLVELLQGTTALHSGKWSDVYDFYMAGGRLETPAGLDERANELIRGLLIRDRRTRWGADEVQRWLDRKTTAEDRARVQADGRFQLHQRAQRPYNVFPSAPTDIPGLVRAMSENPALAEEELMSGDVLLNWIGELDARLARQVRLEREKHHDNPRLAFMTALMTLDSAAPLVLAPGLSVDKPSSLRDCLTSWVAEGKIAVEKVASRGMITRLANWARLHEESDEAMAEGFDALRRAWWPGSTVTVTPVSVRAAFQEMTWLLNPGAPLVIAPGIEARTPAEFARLCYGEQADWQGGIPLAYREGRERWRQGLLTAWLRQRIGVNDPQCRALVENVHDLRLAEGPDLVRNWENVLRMLDPQLPRVTIRLRPVEGNPWLEVVWGQQGTLTLTYEAISPGLPLGVWDLEDEPGGLTISPVTVEGRRGQLRLQLNTAGGEEAGSAGAFEIKLGELGNAQVESPCRVFYKVKFPDELRDKFVGVGAAIGGGILGASRLVAHLVLGGATAATAVPAAGEAVPLTYVGALGVILAGLGVGGFVWYDALNRHKHLRQRPEAPGNERPEREGAETNRYADASYRADGAAGENAAAGEAGDGRSPSAESVRKAREAVLAQRRAEAEVMWEGEMARRRQDRYEGTWDPWGGRGTTMGGPQSPIPMLILVGGWLIISAVVAIVQAMRNPSYLALRILDNLTGASLLPWAPYLAWGFWGALLGAALGFWLVAPVYNKNEERYWYLGGVGTAMVLLGAILLAFGPG